MWQFENVICTGVGATDAFASKNNLVDFVWLFFSGKLCNLQYLRNSTSGDRSQEQKISACKNQIAVSPSFNENSFDGQFHILTVQRKHDQHCNALSDWNVSTINNQHYLYDQHNPAWTRSALFSMISKTCMITMVSMIQHIEIES